MTTWRRASGIVWRSSGERRILMGTEQEEVLVIDGSGGVIWDLLETPTDEARLVAQLSAIFERPVHTTEAETASFLADLRSLGVVESG